MITAYVSLKGGDKMDQDKDLESVLEKLVKASEAKNLIVDQEPDEEMKGILDELVEVLESDEDPEEWLDPRVLSNLIDWLKAKNFSSEDIIDCILHICG